MDCLQLQLQPSQVRTQPFHYLINEQAKSLLALQELQNEVGALLEFRDLVMETFPNLRQKMSSSSSHIFQNSQNYCSTLPLPLSGSLNSRHWEPGIKVKRKIVNKNDNESSLVRARSNSQSGKIQSSQPKSSEAISGVQDSGFSTETNSSNKDHASSTATSVPLPVQTEDHFLTKKETSSHKDSQRSEFDRSDEELSEDGMVLKVNEAEEELWNLLDMIHTKGTKLREEVETLQLRLVVEEIENHLKEKECEIKKVGRKFKRRCRSLDNMADSTTYSYGMNSVGSEPFQPNYKFLEPSLEEIFSKKRTRSIELEDVDLIRQERNMLLEKLAEMETENVANRMKTTELQNEICALINTKEELQEQLLQAVKQKNELNSRIHELHLKFVTGERKLKSGSKTGFKDLTDSESSQSIDETLKTTTGSKSEVGKRWHESSEFDKVSATQNLGALDGIVTNPSKIKKICKLSESSKKKLEAILKEKNYLELQRHLIVSMVENQVRVF